jgi:signal transduction histidine kinase
MAGQRQAARTSGPDLSSWDRYWAGFERWLPYGLLAFSAVAAAVAPQSTGTRVTTLGLVVLAAAWIAVGHTTASGRWFDTAGGRMLYLGGLLVVFALLMSRDMIFFVFAVSGFFHAAVLRPLPLVFVATGTTSLLIHYYTWGGIPTASEPLLAFLAIVLIQTFLIGFGVVGGEKLALLSEQRRDTVDDLEASLAENQRLQAQLVAQARDAGVRDERERMAREIHDTLAQGLTGVITQLQAADQSAHDPVANRRHLDNAAALARESLAEARRSVHALAPGALERGRLPDALDDLVRSWAQLQEIPATAVLPETAVHLPAQTEVALLRVAQEALANVARHAGATRVGVTLSLLDDRVVLDVRDDGRGFDPHTPAGTASFGLTVMRQRVDQLGGTLAVESSPGHGTAVSATIPRADARELTDA